MKKIILLAVLVCFAATGVSAQTEEEETKGQKFFRLTKTADDNPKDWQAQLEAGHFLLDKEHGMYNQTQAGKYYERLYHLATDYNHEIPDSVIAEAAVVLMTAANEKKDIDRALYYIDEMMHAEKRGVDMSSGYLGYVAGWGMMYTMIKEDYGKTLSYITELRERLVKDNTPGIEYTDVFTAMVFERLIEKYRNLFGDKLMEWTLDGKKYYIIATHDWNIERPFMGWLQDTDRNPNLLFGEDGKVYDDIHGPLEYSFQYYKDGVKPSEKANAQLVSVTTEQRQQMVEAYRNYMKKAKKSE